MVDLSNMPLPSIRWEEGSCNPLIKFFRTPQGTFNVNGCEYNADGTPVDAEANYRITAIHPAEPVTQPDGWVDFADACVKDFDGKTVVVANGMIGVEAVMLGGSQHFDWDIGMCKTVDEAVKVVDAAYAAHVAKSREPVLAWDDKVSYYQVAPLGDCCYSCCQGFTDGRWTSRRYKDGVVALLGNDFKTDREAKAACERHAKEEA